jgi:F-type H+-transporting ATPase subunit a
MEHGFTWVEAIPGLSALPAHTATALIVAVLLLSLALAAGRGLAAAPNRLVPDGRLTAREFFEIVTGWLGDLADGLIGHHGRDYVPFFATLFLFILLSNLIGLVPGFIPPTDNFNTTFGLGAVAFVAYNYCGFREHGVKYVKQFLGLAPLMIIVELFSHLFRPISLAIRLFGNMFADHLVLGIFTDLTKVVIPVIFYTLGAFVSVVQAFVFTILTMVYVALAVSHDH